MQTNLLWKEWLILHPSGTASGWLHTLEHAVDIRGNKQNFRTQITGKIMEDYIATILLVGLDLKFWGQFLLFCAKLYQKGLNDMWKNVKEHGKIL